MLPCAWKSMLGIDCFLCGSQRSFIDLLHGDFISSFKMYPPLLPLLFVFLFTLSHLVFKFRFGASMIVKSFSFSVVFILLNYGYKLYTGDIH